MAENDNGVVFDGATQGQGGEATGQRAPQQEAQQQAHGEQQQSEEQPSFVTLEALQSTLDNFRSEFRQDVSREIQSMTDKSRNNLKARVDELLSQIHGLEEAPDAVKANVEAQAWQKALDEQLEQGQVPKGQAPDTDETRAEVVIINKEREKLIEKYGFDIDTNDPEAKDIVLDQGGYAFLLSYEAAQVQKGHRTGTIEKDGGTSIGKAPGLIGGGTPQSNPLSSIVDPTELWKLHKKGGS